jgi:type I restriction enzyme R subunit
MALIKEDHLEQQCCEWFTALGYAHVFAPQLDSDGTSPERTDFRQVILTGRLRSALQRLNPEVPAGTIESAVLQLANPNVPGLLATSTAGSPRGYRSPTWMGTNRSASASR